jgi:hypothetical protein
MRGIESIIAGVNDGGGTGVGEGEGYPKSRSQAHSAFNRTLKIS